VSARREIERQLRTLGEIRDIMNSMKTLAYMETRKLDRLLANQRELVAMIESMAGDLLAHFPALLPQARPAARMCVLVGTERGFCGDFNEVLLRRSRADGVAVGEAVVVGSRLALRLVEDAPPAAALGGASVSESVPGVIDALARTIAALQQQHGQATLTALYHDGERGELRRRSLLPPFTDLPAPPRRFGHPPLLNQTPETFFAALLDHYLFAALHEILYASLKAENLRRVQHLDAAVHHLEDRRTDLARRVRGLRQEEIIEEMEVILLSAEPPSVTPRAG
jgi:F-type H+-transporting ATPase subunit gamma